MEVDFAVLKLGLRTFVPSGVPSEEVEGERCWIVAYRAWGYAGLRICRIALCG